jgi:hypothetical protein
LKYLMVFTHGSGSYGLRPLTVGAGTVGILTNFRGAVFVLKVALLFAATLPIIAVHFGKNRKNLARKK